MSRRPRNRKNRAGHRRSPIGPVAQALIMTLAGVFLVWCVLTKSLPYVWAESDPELALRLNPNNPVALLTLAEGARAQLLDVTDPPEETATLSEDTNGSADPTQNSAPDLATNEDQNTSVAQINALRERVRALAFRAIAVDPLNARGFRLLAEVSDSSDETRHLMQEAVKRSRRETIAIFWLMADSFERQDFRDVVEKADILLRTQSELAPEAMSYLAALAAIPEGRSVLVATLADQPSWRGGFFGALPKNVRFAGTPFELMIALKNAGSPPSPTELAPYLNVLIGAGLVPYAHDIWLQLLPDGESRSRSLLVNANFAENPSGLPFDWSTQRGKNATLEFASLVDDSGARAVRFDFGVGRVQFPELSQLIILEPGRYRLDGEFRGTIRAKRGLRWEIRCWRGKDLAKTEMLYGDPANPWRVFSLDIDVPDQDDCRSQQLRLFHDSRSASEQLISGHASFRRLSLRKIER